MTYSLDGLRHRQVAGFNAGRVKDGNDSRKAQWVVLGASSPEQAETYLISNNLPPSAINFPRPGESTRRLNLVAYDWEELIEGNSTAYLFNADYQFQKLDVDEWTLSVSSTGGSIRVTNSFNTKKYGSAAPDHANAIDVRDGKPQGVDRVIPVMKYTLTYRMNRPANPITYANLASELTGTVNSNAMLGSAAGELLFLGLDGNFGNLVNPEIQFSWAKSKNAILTIGDITSVEKYGHEYLWIQYEEEETGSGATKFVTHKPRGVYVERIYTEADHSTLGLLLSS